MIALANEPYNLPVREIMKLTLEQAEALYNVSRDSSGRLVIPDVQRKPVDLVKLRKFYLGLT